MDAIIEISLITVNKQPVSGDHIDDFIELLEAGKYLPPIVVRKTPTGYVLVDGRHRLRAHIELGRSYIRARITL